MSIFVAMDMLPVEITGPPETIRLGGDTIVVQAAGAATNGDLFAVEVRMPPGGGPPVLHRHAHSEVYRVLSGEFTFYVGEPDAGVRRVTARAGDVVPLAGHAPHTIRNEGEEDAVAFVVHAPGAAMEGFSRAAAALALDGPPTMDHVLQVAERHGIELMGPVPDAIEDERCRRPPSWGDGESGRRVDRSGGTCAGRRVHGSRPAECARHPRWVCR